MSNNLSLFSHRSQMFLLLLTARAQSRSWSWYETWTSTSTVEGLLTLLSRFRTSTCRKR
ncbi:hypothetical protein AB205_0145510 [Aquarana catesbeiana]|uniref:Uncharacterized protein n=1 Tax=Aquarana catesbeiana TaxID=8400 RepID=A0A2G9P4E3_AQUCT|nr:hypothetical protein AB205_0145510 [Aquarana catesbeiana]